MKVTPLLAGLLICAAALAGCAGDDSSGNSPDAEVPELSVTSSTGGIRGVVVDESIRPIEGATVTIRQTGATATTDEKGAYSFSGLAPGTYFVEAHHPLYNSVQQSTEVVAGVKAPKPINFQLLRVITEEPYTFIDKQTGFISCSLNIGAAKSEECGEGLGVPTEVPVIGGTRVGGNDQNRAEIQFSVDGGHIRTLIVEQVWEPSTQINPDGSSGLDTLVALEWSCLPVCGGKILDRVESGPPLLLRVDEDTLAEHNITSESVFSTFSWSAGSVGVMVNQEFELFITSFYYLPAPEGWSFVAGDVPPF